jgi:AcrR family transcriptional regulator
VNDDPRRRSLILAVADRLLRHYGPQKTTVADVAREAGVGVGTVYLEFPSKDVLVEEISRARHGAVLDAMRAAVAAEGRTAAERLVGALDARLDALLALAAEGAHACELIHCVSVAVKTAQASYHEQELALVVDLLRRGAAAGELELEDAELCGRTILRAYATFTTPWLAGKDGREAKQAMAAMHRLVLQGLLCRKARTVETARTAAAPEKAQPAEVKRTKRSSRS